MAKLLRYDDLVAKGVVNNRTTLYRWIKERGFPPGFLIGPNSRVWTDEKVEAWVAEQAAAAEAMPQTASLKEAAEKRREPAAAVP